AETPAIVVHVALQVLGRVVGRARAEAHHDQGGAAPERVLRLVEEHVRAEARRVPQVRAPRSRLLHAEGEAVAVDDDPVRLPLGALPVHGLRRPVHAAGRALALEHQLSRARALPERPHDRIVDVGQRVVGVERHRHSPRSTSALVATPEAPVTSVALHPGTWFDEVPRIWRTPSRIRLKPCTYASESPPPEVT